MCKRRPDDETRKVVLIMAGRTEIRVPEKAGSNHEKTNTQYPVRTKYLDLSEFAQASFDAKNLMVSEDRVLLQNNTELKRRIRHE